MAVSKDRPSLILKRKKKKDVQLPVSHFTKADRCRGMSASIAGKIVRQYIESGNITSQTRETLLL